LTNFQNGGGTSASSNNSSNATGSTGTTGSTGATGGSGTASSTAGSGGLGPGNFNLMVQGTSETLTLYVAAPTRDVTNGQGANDPSVFQPPDLRRIAYWINNGDGLVRQEIKAATATDQLNVMPPDASDPTTCKVIAPEVKEISFQYFDGNAWQDSWDGTQLSSDNTSPLGPPPAIAVVITVDSSAGSRQYRHVVAIPTANNYNPNFLQAATGNATTNQGTTGQ
jgi:hypothetical protein